MRSIDIHAHLLPQHLLRAWDQGNHWHGISIEEDQEGHRYITAPSLRRPLYGTARRDTEERLADMDALGVEKQVVSLMPFLYSYNREFATTLAIARDTNDEIAAMVAQHPQRLGGVATLPMQDVPSAITELQRAMGQLGLKGAMIDDTVNGQNYDEPQFLPFFQAAEQLGALLIFHQGAPTVVSRRIARYHLSNIVGNMLERALTFAHLVYGGVMDRCPNLKVLLCHGGGYTCYNIGRMDQSWQGRPFLQANASQPPSAYLRRFYYDCITQSEASLRFLIDKVGADRVVLGTDWPADMGIDWPVSWLRGLDSLTAKEKELILHKNLENLLGL